MSNKISKSNINMNLELNKWFQMYNSLFLNLFYQDSNPVGHLIPLITSYAKKRMDRGQSPKQILDKFIEANRDVIGEDKIGFMFKIIQYVERQVVLFDSIEDVMSPAHLEDKKVVDVDNLLSSALDENVFRQLIEKINDFSVRIVLTAHPTQFYRPPVLKIIAKLREEVASNNLEKIDHLLHQLGLTSLVNSESPTPLDEARNIIHICRNYYYDAIGDLYSELEESIPELDNAELLTLGFWPCGDRDGNPYVTYQTTKQVIHDLRMTLMKCYYRDLKELSSKLTFKRVEATIGDLMNQVYNAMFSADVIVSSEELLTRLQEVEGIVKDEYAGLYLEELQELIVKVKVFRNHFASLDIRQDSSVHIKTMTEILKKEGIIDNALDELSEGELVEILCRKHVKINEENFSDPLVLDTLRNIKQLPLLQSYNGEKGCHRYIISNSEDKFAVLFVFGMFRWIHPDEEIHFDIIPLFETMKGMSACERVMDDLFSIPEYRNHVENRKDNQVMMLGFSDGTKDGGYLTANWSIYKSKERLSRVCKSHGVKALFFDGRGGPPARGGGKTHKFYAARGPEIANNGIQITIQGQTITSTYGTVDKFKFNAEQMISSGLYSHIHQEKATLSIDQRQLIEQLSVLSYEKYTELKSHPSFLPYLEKMTTLKYYSAANIGSRPSKRNKTGKLTLKDLRAISYVGSWSQLKQNIPGYFGLGTALQAFQEMGRLDEVKHLYKESPFFATLIDNCMMSLTKCLFSLTSYMKESEEFGSFWNYLYEEYKISKKMILEITGLNELMENEKRSRESIRIREEIVLPLILVQNYALQEIQEGGDNEDEELYKKLVHRSLYGNINASRNSA